MSDGEQENEVKTGKNKKKSVPSSNLPIILEICFTLARLLVTIVPVVVTGLSLLTGTSLVIAALRGCAAAFVLGLLTWFVSWRLAKGMFSVIHKQLQNVVESASSEHTVEWRA